MRGYNPSKHHDKSPECTPQALSEMMDNPGRNLKRFQDKLSSAVYREHTLTHVLAQNVLTQEKRRINQELRDCLDSRFSSLQ